MSPMEDIPRFLRLQEFYLPRNTLPECQYLFCNTKTIAAAISRPCSTKDIKNYLQSYDRGVVEQQVSITLGSGRRSVAFYAVYQNSVDILELLLQYGVDPNSEDSLGVPLLAAAIMWTKWTYKNADKVVTLLLSYGANPRCIPEHMWSKYIAQPQANSNDDKSVQHSVAWAMKEHRLILQQTLNLTLRYLLHRASLTRSITKRQRQVAESTGYPRILRLPFHLVGQDKSLEVVMNKIMAYDALNRKRPLVLAFAGLSGHGKTELATSMGFLLGTEICNVDMSKICHSMELFGAPAPFSDHEKDSPLNNYLANHRGKRCVVFLDEFDKTNQSVRESLLVVLDSGSTMDLRSNTPVDATKSIWILASNRGDELIDRFYKKNMEGKSERQCRDVSIQPLQKDLFRLFIDAYTPAVTGRISAFLPFFPFSQNEAAVITHKFLTSLSETLRQPLDLDSTPPRPIAHIDLVLHDDGDLCKYAAETGYVRELGARSIQNTVDGSADMLTAGYLSSDVLIDEKTNKGDWSRWNVQLHPVDGENEVVVFENGTTQVPKEFGNGGPDDEDDGSL